MIRALLGINPLWMALGAAVALCGGLYWHNGTLQAQNALLTLRVDTCDARAKNLIEDKESDASIDRLDDLTDVPDRWLRP